MNGEPERFWDWRVLDITGDGRFLFDDVSAWAAYLLFLPGNAAISLLSTHAPSLATFFGIGPDDQGGTLSLVLSIVIWWIALLLVGLGVNVVRNFDLALTAWIRARYNDTLRLLRVGRHRLMGWIARRRD